MAIAAAPSKKDRAPTREAPDDQDSREGAASEQAAARPRRWTLSRKWVIGAALAIWIVLNVAILAGIRMKGAARAEEAPPAEIALGTYHFEADKSERSKIVGVKFTLHISLVAETAAAARQRLAARTYRIQQDIEELMRKAHGGDFEDPRLKELKRQLSEQIDETLGMHAVADVIITDLSVIRAAGS